MRKALSLIELIIVLIVVGIIAGLGTPFYRKAVDRAKSRGSVAQLRLIQAAENMYKLMEKSYLGCSGYAACNTALNIDLPDDGWTYEIDQVTGTNFRGRASMSMPDGTCTYTIDAAQINPSYNQYCVYEP
ncbi:MAG: prepilin-type N-terminal cleavage/methylation domain-containing protein [Candidatus Omnitrophota bacterium]